MGHLKYIAPLFLSCLSIISCSSVEDEEGAGDIERIVFELSPILEDDEAETKTVVSVPSTGFSVTWAVDDTVGIYPNKGSQVYFSMAEGVGTNSATFDGGGWAFRSLSQYYSYYPFIGNIYLNRTRIPVSYSGQKQTGLSNTNHLGKYMYTYTEPTSAETGALNFVYKHLSSIMRVNATLDPGTYTKLSLNIEEPLFIIDGTYSLLAETPSITGKNLSNTLEIDLESFTVDNPQSVYIYLAFAPVNLKGKTVNVVITDDNHIDYQCVKTVSGEYVRGTRYGLTCSTWEKLPQSMNSGFNLIYDDPVMEYGETIVIGEE